jgi:glycosyltransferase involved in cell wall biosynthesis
LPVLVSRRVAYPIKPGLARKRYLTAQRILAISHFVHDSVVRSGIPAEKLDLVYEGVDVPQPVAPEVRASARQRWGVAENQVLIGCVGYLLPEKGQEFLVKALPAVCAKYPNARLLLAGDGPCRARLQDHCHANGLAEAVIFAGFVKDISQVYAALDVFAFPSLAEPLGTSLLAAMAGGLPVLAVASGGIPEYVESGQTGLLVPRPEADLFSAELIKLLDDPKLAVRLGAAAKQQIQGHFSAQLMVENTIHVYEKFLE